MTSQLCGHMSCRPSACIRRQRTMHYRAGDQVRHATIIAERRFWLVTAIACGLGVALFYGDWVAAVGA